MKFLRNPALLIVLVRTSQMSAIGLALHWILHWPLAGPYALGFFLTPALCLYFVFVFVGPWRWGLPILTRLPTRENSIALTFDDGPSLENTLAAVSVLKAYQVTATFFMLGENAERHPEVVQQVIAAGHTVGIHAYHHQPLTLASLGTVRKEISRTVFALRKASSDAPNTTWMRPPYGFKSAALPFFMRLAGRRMVAWSINSRDYAEGAPEQIAQNVLRNLHPGAIALLHDGPGNAASITALPLILDGLRARGYKCVVLPVGIS